MPAGVHARRCLQVVDPSVKAWLEANHLGMLLPHFIENEIEWSDLFTLTKSDLKEELGIAKLANRKLLFEALENLRDQDAKPCVPLQPEVRACRLLTWAIGGRGHAWWGKILDRPSPGQATVDCG